MKRVGLVTWYRGTNYGSVLQAYALQKALQDSGCSVCFVRSFEMPFTLRNIRINLFGKYGIMRHNPLKDSPFRRQRERFAAFAEENFRERLPLTAREYRKMLSGTDAFLCGSDQIWNCRNGFDPFLFLDFAGKVKRLSYAASIGTGDIPEEYAGRVKALLSRFEHIGVREKSAEKALSALTGRSDIRTVLDPTFLLDAPAWREFARGSKAEGLPDGKYIFCYFVGKASDYAEQLRRVKALTGIANAVLLPSNYHPTESLEGAERIEDAGPREFVALLDGAAVALTDSFHGSALSLNLGRQLYCVKRFSDDDPLSQNSRLYDLFDLLGTGNRFLENGAVQDIDYKQVVERLGALRQESAEFLKTEVG